MRQVAGLFFALLSSSLHAYPDGAPWGAADPSFRDHCSSCHWERPSRSPSAALQLRGMPMEIQAGAVYDLTLVLTDADARIAGFQVMVEGSGTIAGDFETGDSTLDIASFGTAIRTIAPKPLLAGRVVWHWRWQVPTVVRGDFDFYVAVSAANGDGSPFGDVVHYQRFTVGAVDQD